MKLRRVILLIEIICLAVIGISFIDFGDIYAASSIGLGDVDFTEKRDIYNGVSLEYAVGFNNNEEQKAYTVEIGKNALIPYATFGEYVYGGEILSNMIKKGEKDFGKKVVVAINGDFYDTSNGVPRGIMIVNGKLVSLGYEVNQEAAVGFKNDGTVIFSKPNFEISFNDGNNDYKIDYLNNDRKYNTSSLFLYTSDFAKSTKSYAQGKEVVLSTEGETFKVGETITCKVESVGTIDSEIGPGKVVIASGNKNDSRLASLDIGKEITIKVEDKKPGSGWNEVVQSIGYPHLLAENGKATSTAINDPAVHPRTALGIKEDGTTVLFQVDGRQPGWSNGLSFKQMVEWMVDKKGCKTVVNLDGGGSSTIMARLPGNENAEVLNSPSDGGERSNCNALLFFANDNGVRTGKVSHLHTYPKNLCILGGGETKINVKATDENFYPVDTPSDLVFVSDDDGIVIDNKGNVKVSQAALQGKILVSSGESSCTTDVTIIDKVTKISCDKTIISIAPNDKCAINVVAYNGSMPLVASNSSFKWYLSSNTLGTISNGIFTGSNNGGTGTLSISYKSYSLVIPVEVGKLPTMIQTFENISIGKEWIETIENSGNGGKGKVSINTDERYVKFGKKSLRIDYDFRSATATTSVTAYQSGGYTKLQGYPTNIGMWVYGDNNGANVRIQIRDGKNAVQYISFNPSVVDWVGWKYIEADIPSGLPAPIQIQYPIRVMSVGGKVKTNGTLYFDNLRAVYGFKNDDVKEPTFTNFTPENGSVSENNQEKISLKIVDEKDSNGNLTGINKNSIQMWINEEEIKNLVIVDNVDGSHTVNYTPSALTLLKPGPQIIKVRAEDNYGNITIKNWQFILKGEYADINGIIPENKIVYAGDRIKYYLTSQSYKNFEKVSGTLNFNNKALKLQRFSLVDKNLTITTDSISSANDKGSLKFTISDMLNHQTPDDKVMALIEFSTKEGFAGGSDTALTFSDVLVYEKGYSKPTKFMLPSYEVKVDYHLRLKYITSTVNSTIEFTVTDENLNPVKDAIFTVSEISRTINAKTDEFGKASLDDFKDLSVGSSFKIKTSKGNYYSENINVTILDSLYTSNPTNLIVSPGYNAENSVYITWRTNITTKDSIVKYRVKGTTDWIEEKTNCDLERVYVTSTGTLKQEYLSHIVRLDSLSPNKTYEYTVGDLVNTSDINTFSTASKQTLDLIFLGDPQNTSAAGYQITKNVLDAALNKSPNAKMVLYAGDIVDDVTINSQWEAFNSVLGSYNRSIITASATGNHDVITNYALPFKAGLSPSNNGLDTIGANYYFEAGQAIFAVIDTETASMYEAQANWLKKIMASSDKKFKIVLMHRGPYCSNYNEPHVRDFWPKVFEDARIDLVLSGHDHVYASTTMHGKQKVALDKGVTYVVGGTSGQKYYSANNLEERYWLDYVFDDDYPVFSTIRITNENLHFESYALKGSTQELINSITLTPKEDDASELQIDYDKKVVSSLKPLDIKAVAKNSSGEIVGNASIRLKQEVEGIEIIDNKLVVSNELKQMTDVSIIIQYGKLIEEISITCRVITAFDVVSIQKDYFNNLEFYK